MYQHTCSICGKVFTHPNKTFTKKIKEHIKQKHNLNFKEYIIQTFFNNVHPICHCGCGKECNFHEKNALWSKNHGFNKYFNCSHVCRTEESKYVSYKKYLEKWNNEEWVKSYYNEIFGLNVLQETAISFINGKSALELSKEVNIDVRTLKSAWIKLKLLNEEQLKEISKKRKYKGAIKRRKIFDNSEEILPKLYQIIVDNPQKYNIRSLIKFYNKLNISKIETIPEIVYNSLYETYGDVILDLLQFGNHSKEELKFLDILQFYFNKRQVKCGYKIYYGEVNKRQYYVYDFCINNKLLIEYDGEGYYHNSVKAKKQDKIKEELAINKGYKFLRLSNTDIKKPEIILQIKKIIENDTIY